MIREVARQEPYSVALIRSQVQSVLEGRRKEEGSLAVIRAKGSEGKERHFCEPSLSLSSHVVLVHLACRPQTTSPLPHLSPSYSDLMCCHIAVTGRNLKVTSIQSSIEVWIPSATSSRPALNISTDRERVTQAGGLSRHRVVLMAAASMPTPCGTGPSSP